MTPARDGRSTDGRFRAAAVIVVAAAVLLIAYPLRYVLIPFAVAGGMAFATSPAVEWLQRRLRFPHVAAVLAVFAPTSAAGVALAYWIGTSLAHQAQELAVNGPTLLAQLLREVMSDNPGQADAVARQVWQQLQESLAPSANAAALVSAAFAVVMGGVLTIVLYFYFLYDGERLAHGTLWLVPPGRREAVRSVGLRVRPMLRRYVIGLAVVVAFTAAISWVWLSPVMGVPHAELLALTTGVLELIPVIGPIGSAAVVSGAALDRGGVSALVLFLVFYIVLRLVIDQGVGPLVMGRAARLHPVVVLFVFIVGGVLYGPLGVLLAVPLAATVKIVLMVYYDESEAKPPPPPSLVDAKIVEP